MMETIIIILLAILKINKKDHVIKFTSKVIKELNELSKKLDINNAVECIEKELKLEEELNKLLSELFSYICSIYILCFNGI